jgi:hypothetical protein
MAASPDGANSLVLSVNEQLAPELGAPACSDALHAREWRAVCVALSNEQETVSHKPLIHGS